MRDREVNDEDKPEEILEPEKNDLAAMWISAMLTLWLPAILILILLCAVVCLPFLLL